ncbi:MAG: abortive infection family protein [Phycisphaerae bacterium]|nr:abortive infection family protein [Phycisphaerae bacterium]
MKASPKYIMQLIPKIENVIWKEFSSYKNVEGYIRRWHEESGYYENFNIATKDDGNIDLASTLRGIQDDELLFRIAVDVGIEIPDLVYSIPEIKGILASDYKIAASTFENALRKVDSEPATSVCCANSALESIIKHICQDETMEKCNPNNTLYDLVQHVLKEFKLYPCKDMESEIRNIGSSLLAVAQNIEAMRSKHADTSHGKTSDDYIIDNELYSKFILNAVTTVGLFLLNFYEKIYLPNKANLPSAQEDIPF